MKKFIVHGETIKIFTEEKDLIKYLGNEKSKGKKLEYIRIEVVEIKVDEEVDALNYLNLYVEKTNIQTKINSVLGDETSQRLERFKKMFIDLAKDDVLKKRFLSQLEAVPVEKKSLAKLFSGWVGYLFSVNESVEWFRAILDIHNFRKIEDFYVREIFYSNGTSRYANVKVNESAKENFQIAKSLT
jgi:hypothetical protein